MNFADDPTDKKGELSNSGETEEVNNTKESDVNDAKDSPKEEKTEEPVVEATTKEETTEEKKTKEPVVEATTKEETTEEKKAEETEPPYKVSLANGNIQIITGETKSIEFGAGDNITIHYKIKEGNKERIQQFKGVVLQRKGKGTTETVTVRKVSGGIGVERIIPIKSPFIDKIEMHKRGKVRRARIFYLRDRKGKSARIKEKRT